MILTYSVNFSCIACRYFSKWWLKIFSGGNHPRTHHLWRLILPHLKGVTPNFVHQKDRKGCILDNLDGFGHFLFGFGATRKNSRGGGNHPLLVRRGFTCYQCILKWKLLFGKQEHIFNKILATRLRTYWNPHVEKCKQTSKQTSKQANKQTNKLHDFALYCSWVQKAVGWYKYIICHLSLSVTVIVLALSLMYKCVQNFLATIHNLTR